MKTKIIATIGPAACTQKDIEKFLRAGMNIARLNMSHGTHDWYKEVILNIKRAAKNVGTTCTLLLDTKGPEIRTLNTTDMSLKKGATYTIGSPSAKADIPISYAKISSDLKKGQKISLDEGNIIVQVQKKQGELLSVKSLNKGILTPKRHVNIPGVQTSLPFLSTNDKNDIAFGIQQGIHMIAASFVRTAKDILSLRKEVSKHTTKHIPIIAKIEASQALEHIDAIVEVADGIMIARGDLGVEIPFERIPATQNMLIEKAIAAQKPVIMATQMLESMTQHPSPTRAEITDIANAVYRHVDAVMLSGETSKGQYPTLSIETMSKIATEVEKGTDVILPVHNTTNNPEAWELLKSAVELAEYTEARHIVVITNNLLLLQQLTSLRAVPNVLLLTTNSELHYYAQLLFGVTSLLSTKKEIQSFTTNTKTLLKELQKQKKLRLKEKVVLLFDTIGNDQILDTIQLRTL